MKENEISDDIQTIDKISQLNVTMFDNFQIFSGENKLDEKNIRSDMLTKLLSYMICHRNSNLSIQELTDALWEDEECDNPTGALKNLMYRLRSILKKYISDKQFIITGRGYYKWNNDIQLESDVEKFEEVCKLADKTKDKNKRITYAMKADSYYKGRFLPQYVDDYWVVSLNVYYHSLYLNTIKHLAHDLETQKRYFEMEEVCHNAIEKDELDEDLHYYFIKALINENKRSMAVEHYNKTSDLLYDKIGVRPSDKLRNIYEVMLKQQHEKQLNISTINRELSAFVNVRNGAFFCEYGVFKKNYELEVRRSRRNGSTLFLALITIQPQSFNNSYTENYNSIVRMGAKQIQNILMCSLRAGDVISRYSVEQFIIMLSECNYDNALNVMNRIIKIFDGLKFKAKIKIQYSIEEIK